MNTLFSEDPGERDRARHPLEPALVYGWSDEWAVTEEELAGAVRRMAFRNVASGPDEIPGRVWALALREWAGRLRRLFTECLRTGVFLVRRRAKLAGKPVGTPSAYRPICLLDKVGKLFEKVIAQRLVQYRLRIGPPLHTEQYGFREDRGTTDAVLRVKALTGAIVGWGRGGVGGVFGHLQCLQDSALGVD